MFSRTITGLLALGIALLLTGCPEGSSDSAASSGTANASAASQANPPQEPGRSGDRNPRNEGPEDVADRPDEGVILLEELRHIVERSGLGALPQDPETVMNAIATMPENFENVMAMHTGRIQPNENESVPGVGPVDDLLMARLELLLGGEQLQRNLEDVSDGEMSILLLPMDGTTVITILPTNVVKADPEASPLPEVRVDLSDVTYEINDRTRTVDEYMQSGTTNGLAFMHHGQLVYDDYENGFNPETRQHVWSVTKSVTSALVGIAVSEGLVDSIHDPIKKYIPEAAGTVWEGVSVKNLLQMKSGTYWVDVPIHQPEQLLMMGSDFHSNGLYGMTRDEYLLQLTRVAPPGAFYRYNSGDPQMLAWMLENIYDKPYAELLSEKIWQPAGMENDALVMVDRLGNTFASMGLHATARDMLRFGELYRNGGRTPDGRQIVPQKWVKESHNYDVKRGGGERGYMWPHWDGVDSGNYTASGYGGQRTGVAPSEKLVSVRFGNDPADSISGKEWESVTKAVADFLENGNTQ